MHKEEALDNLSCTEDREPQSVRPKTLHSFGCELVCLRVCYVFGQTKMGGGGLRDGAARIWVFRARKCCHPSEQRYYIPVGVDCVVSDYVMPLVRPTFEGKFRETE